jgi:hypothetical protein
MSKRTATQRHIDNINSYISKVGRYFGVESPEYNKTLAIIHNAGLKTYEVKKGTDKGIVKIKNTKKNRQNYQKIRSIDKNKPSFARQKRRYEKEKAKIREAMGFDGIGDDGSIGGGGKPVISFDDWYNGWRETWDEAEQYEIAKLADDLGVSFDYNEWYNNYEYREQILHDLYSAWIESIAEEVSENSALNPDVGNIDESTGENIVFGNVNKDTETEIE